MKYRNDMPKNKNGKSYGGSVGCVYKPSEEKMAMLKNGGEKYSYDNPMELKQHADKLAKVLK